MEKREALLVKYWPIIIAMIMFIYQIGITSTELSGKVDKDTVRDLTKQLINEYAAEQNEKYIEINKVPGLKERLGNLEKEVREIKDLQKKIYEIFLTSERKQKIN